MPIFPLTLERTYFNQGFFNVRVDFDKYVRKAEGPVDLVLLVNGREQRLVGKINRTANTNGTARVMGGAPLREWFMTHFDEGTRLDVDLGSTHEIRIKKANA